MTPVSQIAITSLHQPATNEPTNNNGFTNSGFNSKQPFSCAGSIFVRVTIPLSLLMAVSIFLVGVLMGPLWLVCIGVAIAVATMACTMYLYSIAKKVFFPFFFCQYQFSLDCLHKCCLLYTSPSPRDRG